MDPGTGSGAFLRAVAVRSRNFVAALRPNLCAKASLPLLCMQAYHIRRELLRHADTQQLGLPEAVSERATLFIPRT